jgi:hypothetical protein
MRKHGGQIKPITAAWVSVIIAHPRRTIKGCKMNKDKAWIRANNFGNAELAEFQRYLKNKNLRNDVHIIQAKTSLPLTLKSGKVFFEDPAYVDWMGWDESNTTVKREKLKRLRKVTKDVNNMLDTYKIPSHFFGSLLGFVVTGDRINTYQTKGFPNYTFNRHEDGEWKHECIITPETDLGNPVILKNIKEWQRIYKNKPPLPIMIGRKKDWTPVWEWRNRNPSIPDSEIAIMTGVNRITLVRALRQLDKMHGTTK